MSKDSIDSGKVTQPMFKALLADQLCVAQCFSHVLGTQVSSLDTVLMERVARFCTDRALVIYNVSPQKQIRCLYLCAPVTPQLWCSYV